ncbi:MAG: hypothetical protein GY873_33400 [Bosea sp.]|uniref:hypothetical protein n=1 Tax=Bosea sp. (in: a-proteobacteria) TaxID=1871050 RepID=UPI00238D59F5|nr:hypothetical protein [Bosea sp. (in: a-proteobacteria)]MCP4739089.1 hypothetical protein [Bosea sp. (in: a-proteobacteria)]
MSGGVIGPGGLLAFAGGLFAITVASAQSQSAAEGAAFCKANLAAAPPGLMLGEVEAFCTCMGVQESAMFRGDMTDAAKASLRPQLQQMCVAIVRNQAQVPGQAAVPATSPSPPPAESAEPVVRRPGMLPFEGTWRLRAEEVCGSPMGMTITKAAIIQGATGNAETSEIIAVKRVNEMSYRLTIRDLDGRSGRRARKTVYIGIENGNAITGDGPIFPGHSVQYLRCPDQAPAGAVPVRPQPKPAAPALGEAECRALLKRTGDALMPRMQQLVPLLNNVSSPAQFCNASRQTVAFHNEVKRRIAACSAHGFVKKLIGESNTAISTARAQMRQVGC